MPKDPFASDDITGAIPSARETSLPDGGAEAIPAQNAAPDAAAPGASAPPPKSNVPASAASAPPSLAPKPLTGFAAAIKRALDSWPPPQGKGRQAAELWLEHKDIAAYYAARDYAPLWISDGKPVAAVANIESRLALAGDDGLSLAGIPQADFSGDSDHLAAAEIAFSEEIVAYGREASGVRIDPQDINPLIGTKPDVAAPGLILGAVAAAGLDGGAMLQSFNPQQKPYLALRAKLIALRRQGHDAVASGSIPPGPSLKLGMTDPRVPLIRARFGLDVVQGDADLIYDTQVAAAVADFQRNNGLRPSASSRNVREKSLTAEQKPDVTNEIIANMEVWRWMPRDLGQSRIDVNIPDFEVRVVRDGTVVLTNIAGGRQADDADARVLQHDEVSHRESVLECAAVDPAQGDAAALARDPYYLQRMGFEMFHFHGRLMARQPPGEKNALGADQVHVSQPISRSTFTTRRSAVSSPRRNARSATAVCVSTSRSTSPKPFSDRNGRRSASSGSSAARNITSSCPCRYRSISNISPPMWMTTVIWCCAATSMAMSTGSSRPWGLSVDRASQFLSRAILTIAPESANTLKRNEKRRSFSLAVVIKRAANWHHRRHRFATFAGLPVLVFIFDNV